MSDTYATIRHITLDKPIERGETKIGLLTLRKPDSGALRGLSLVDLGLLKVDTLIKVVPRITTPPVSETEVASMDPADLLAIGAEVGSFLLQKATYADALTQ